MKNGGFGVCCNYETKDYRPSSNSISGSAYILHGNGDWNNYFRVWLHKLSSYNFLLASVALDNKMCSAG